MLQFCVCKHFGIAINFIEIIFRLQLPIGIRMIIYILSILIPIIIIGMEWKNINFSELIYLALGKTALFFNNTKQAKNFLTKLVEK